jgi:hypothetical protein
MPRRKKAIILLLSIVYFSLVGLLFTLGFEKDIKNINESKAKETKIEDKYFEKAEKLGIEEDKSILNAITRSMKKINNQDRVFKLASNMVSEFNYLINTQQLEKAYKMLDSEYTEEFGLTYEVFEAKNKGEKIDKYVISYIEEMKTEGIILIEYLVVAENGFIRKDMSVIEKNGEYTLTLNGLSEKTRMKVDYEEKGIKTSVTRRYKVGDSVAYKFTLENTTDKDIKIRNYPNGFFGVVQNQKYSHTILSSITPNFSEDYIIKAGESKQYIVKFNTVYYLEKIGIELENKDIIVIPIYNM